MAERITHGWVDVEGQIFEITTIRDTDDDAPAEYVIPDLADLVADGQPQEVRQPGNPNAFSASGLQQHPVHPAEPARVIAQHGTARTSHRAP
jgi:hypothetical protein